MGTTIVVNGKGGTGKTTLTALFVAALVRQKRGSVLAIDADPNSCLAEALGAGHPSTIVGICDEVSKNMNAIPAGMTKDRYIEMRVQDALAECEGFDLLVMGRPEGPGCYCYVNNLLRGVIAALTVQYDYVIVDNAAGMEHISRRTMRDMGRLVVVSDYSINGVRAAKRIYELARELQVRSAGAYLILNKVSGTTERLDADISASGLKYAGDMPYDETLAEWNLSGASIFTYKTGSIHKRTEQLLSKCME